MTLNEEMNYVICRYKQVHMNDINERGSESDFKPSGPQRINN
jgi:hypothetical protein